MRKIKHKLAINGTIPTYKEKLFKLISTLVTKHFDIEKFCGVSIQDKDKIYNKILCFFMEKLRENIDEHKL